MVIFKRITMPKEKIPNGISFKVNKKGWMMESVMKEWLNECYVKRPGGFFRQKKALLVLDSMRAHITDNVKAFIKSTNSIPAVIPGGTTKDLQPLDISVNRAFKVALCVQWEAWMTSGDKSFTNTGRMQKATFAQVYEWVLMAWGSVKTSTIINRFQKAGLLRDEEDATTAEAPQRLFDSDSDEEEFVGFDSDNEGERRVADEATLSLFVSDTEDEDFGGFSTQEEDGDDD